MALHMFVVDMFQFGPKWRTDHHYYQSCNDGASTAENYVWSNVVCYEDLMVQAICILYCICHACVVSAGCSMSVQSLF